MTPDDIAVRNQLNELKETVAGLKDENERLEKLAQQSDAANKAKSDFLAMISHEIRTPMNGVIGLTELLLDTELNTKQSHYTGLILTSARNLLTLINSLLDFSKIEADMMELDIAEFNLRELIEELMALYNVATERKDVEVYSQIDPGVEDLYKGDSYRIRQILVNLLGNAIKFTDEGSVVLNVLSNPSDDGVKDMLRFEVQDSGLGIPSDKLDRLFKPFSQVDTSSTRRYGGTGLGLSICQKLVELMGGKIGVESEMGAGCMFWFALPLEPVASQLSSVHDPPNMKGRQITPQKTLSKEIESEKAPLFMIVDDDETNRFVLETVLLKAGARVLTARNGKEAIDLFLSDSFDLIMMDCQMPVMDGFEACELMHTKAVELSMRRPRIIALTADATQSTRQFCKKVGMDDYLTKPLEFGKLQRVIDNWLPGSGIRIIGHTQGAEIEEGAEIIVDAVSQEVQIDSKVLERLKKNMGDISPVINVFLASLPVRLDELGKAVDNADPEEIRRISHTLKGSSSQFGAIHMSNLCFQAENIAKYKQLDDIHSLYEKIRLAADGIAQFLSEELDKK